MRAYTHTHIHEYYSTLNKKVTTKFDGPRRYTFKRGQKVPERKISEVPPHFQVLANNIHKQIDLQEW